jgi:hypothetical protein
MAQARGEPVMTAEAILEQSRQAQDAPPRDLSAPWGSELNPALILDGRIIEPGAPRAQRSADVVLLSQYRQLAEDPFMRGQVARFRQRRGGGGRARAAAIGRSEDCIWCSQENLSDEQSYLLHSDPQWNVPITPRGYFDADEEPSTRTFSGTGWPVQTPMIYR